MSQLSASRLFEEVAYGFLPIPQKQNQVKVLPFLVSLIALTLLKWVSICPVQQLHLNKVNYADSLLI